MRYNYEEKPKTVSDDCFRILSLRVEVQNDVEVVKPVLEELEVMRLSCSLGMLSDVNLRDFKYELLEPREFDDDFARFLRNDVFKTGHASSRFRDDDEDMDSYGNESDSVKVMSLFGEQSEVKRELQRLGCWSAEYEANLRSQDQGIYCTLMTTPREDYSSQTGALVLFAWLQDHLFRPECLRDTATYILRFLTCLSPDIVCCLSSADVESIQKLVASLTSGSKQAFKSYSVAFRVEKQETVKDEVRCEHVKNIDLSMLPSSGASRANRRIIKGSFPGMVVTTPAPATTRVQLKKVEFSSVDELAHWIASHAKNFKVHTHIWGLQFDQHCRRQFLMALDKLPERELGKIDDMLARSEANVVEQSKEEVAAFVEEQRALLLNITDQIFSVDLLLKSSEVQKASKDFVDCLQSLKQNGAVWSQVDPVTQVAVHLPIRLKFCMQNFYGLFNEDSDELDGLLKKIVTMRGSGIYDEYDADHKRGILAAMQRGIRRLFGGNSDALDISAEFREYMAPVLGNMKQVWWDAVEKVFDAVRENLWQKWAENNVASLRTSCDADRCAVITEAFEKLLESWRCNADADLNLKLDVRDVRGRAHHYFCDVHEDVWEPPSEQMEVFKIDLDAAVGLGMRSLGVYQLKEKATVLDVFSVQANAVLVLLSTHGGVQIERVQFPVHQSAFSLWNSNRGTVTSVKSLGRKATHCDFFASERLIALVNNNDDVALYKCNESFTSMEIVNSFNLNVRTSLSTPLADILLLESGIFMRDGTQAAQSVNLRSQQISRKSHALNRDSGGASWSSTAFLLADGLVVACLSTSDDGSGATRCELSAISSEDHRKVPVKQSQTSLPIQLLSRDGISVQSFGNFLLVADPLIDHIQVLDVCVTVRSDSFRIRHSGGKKSTRGSQELRKGDDTAKLDHWLWAFFHVFEKFPVTGLLDSARHTEPVQVKIVCSSVASSDEVLEACKEYFESIMSHLRKLNKPLGKMDLADALMVVTYSGAGTSRLEDEFKRLSPRSILAFLQEVVTFVPIQICRAEANMLTVMTDGQDKSSQIESMEQSRQIQSADIARSIRFGLLSPLLESWRGRCIVVTSMGKQSTGKSYFLNHLTGSSFAIAGARCTDGAWMTVRVLPNDVMLVVLDFEGLGSFERTEQEDVFLSVLNAAMSMFTIFRMDMRLDKEIDSLFTKFQKGVQLIKNDPRLFRGILYMGVKDVNPNDQNGVVGEFVTKFDKLVSASKEHNFLLEMYRGHLEINCSPPLGTKGYYDSLENAQELIEKDLCGSASMGFSSGKAFLDCLRLVLAKISILDWTSLDESNQKLQLSEVRSKLAGLVRTGCLIPSDRLDDAAIIGEHLKDDILDGVSEVDLEKMCREFPEMAETWCLLDRSVHFDRIRDREIDLLVDCSSVGDSLEGLQAIGKTLVRLFEMYQEKAATPRNRKLSAAMQASFDAFLVFLVRRRKLRILAWVKSLLGEQLPEDWSGVESQFVGQFQLLFNRCSHRCTYCQLGCMQSAAHTCSIAHDCGMDHHCHGRCEYCKAIGGEGKTPLCSKPAGHEGKCECEDGDHTCGEECCLIRAANCGRRCVKLVNHGDMHECSVEVHRCGLECSSKNCSSACILSISTPHTAHKCEQTTCVEKCSMDGCSHLCGHSDHFHGQTDLAVVYSVENPSGKGENVFDAESQTPTIHMCSNTHDCQAMCSEKGNCCVEVFHKESSKTFDGVRGKFKYKFQEMNGFRKKCAVVLAPGQQTHSGAHTCVATLATRLSDADMQDAMDEDSEDMHRSLDDSEDDGISDDEEKQSEDECRILHFCEARCPCCSYFCKKEYGHFGMHTTSHGNMRNTYFLADTNDIDIEERKYAAGESGGAEMCNLYCSKMGRGHVHYLECEQKSSRSCVYVGNTTDQRRHCTRVLEPKPANEMDELLHEQFWKTLGWEDPCASQDERELFGKCALKCDAPDHSEKQSYCVLPAWHKHELKPGQQDGFSYVDGHKFGCSHLVDSGKMHHVFVLDCSGSMFGRPWEQLMSAYREYMHNRVNEGASLDLVSVVTFDNYSKIEYEAKNITTMLTAPVEFRGGGTSYSAGLRSANEVLSRNSFGTYKPVVVFFSDGQPCDPQQGEQLATHVHDGYAKYDLKAFVVGYGTVNLSVLQRVAEKLGGAYHSVLVGNELKTTFHTISASLGTRAGLALTKPLHEISCVICQRDMAAEEVVKLQPCGHELHKSCKKQLVESAKRNGGSGGLVMCPICRKSVVR